MAMQIFGSSPSLAPSFAASSSATESAIKISGAAAPPVAIDRRDGRDCAGNLRHVTAEDATQKTKEPRMIGGVFRLLDRVSELLFELLHVLDVQLHVGSGRALRRALIADHQREQGAGIARAVSVTNPSRARWSWMPCSLWSSTWLRSQATSIRHHADVLDDGSRALVCRVHQGGCGLLGLVELAVDLLDVDQARADLCLPRFVSDLLVDVLGPGIDIIGCNRDGCFGPRSCAGATLGSVDARVPAEASAAMLETVMGAGITFTGSEVPYWSFSLSAMG